VRVARAAHLGRVLCLLLLSAYGLQWSDPSVGAQVGIYYVAIGGSDVTGDGSAERPWASLNHAAAVVPDRFATVMVGDGTYDGPVRIARTFTTLAAFRPQNPYRVRLEAVGEPVVTLSGGGNYSVVGFEITRAGPGAAGTPLVHISGEPGAPAKDIQFRDNVVHDSYTSDLMVIGEHALRIVVEGNLFYNQGGFDSHVDASGVEGLSLHGNVFFNDLLGSGRLPGGEDSFVVVRDGAARNRDIDIDRNIFLHWEGAPTGYFLQVGSGGSPYQTESVHVDSNLFIGDSVRPLRAALGVHGARDVSFRANTVVGDMPAAAFAAHLARTKTGPPVSDVRFYNNIWADATGTMVNFADGPPADALGVRVHNNLYWNGGLAVPDDGDLPSPAGDDAAVRGDPLLPLQAEVMLPRWDAATRRFHGGHADLRAVFAALAGYARTAPDSPAMDRADGAQMPLLDLLGRPRGAPDIGALEYRPTSTPSPTAPAEWVRLYVPAAYRSDKPRRE